MQDSSTRRLAQALLSLRTPAEMQSFLEDLCTIQELKSMAQRYEVAELLDKKWTYAQISEKTGASTATISRVNRCLMYGAEGYRRVLERMKQVEKEEGT
ncbi:MAG: YerC/YecD family TrpR-related protein [Clostridiales bacterium]|nr:YerC/YecD family TrpR-related protein [Clostridiales bacterium]